MFNFFFLEEGGGNRDGGQNGAWFQGSEFNAELALSFIFLFIFFPSSSPLPIYKQS